MNKWTIKTEEETSCKIQFLNYHSIIKGSHAGALHQVQVISQHYKESKLDFQFRMVCSWLLELCRHDDIKTSFWDIKIIWKQILLSPNRGYSKHLLTCSGVFGKQADLKSRTQHAGSCGRWFESTIRRRGFSRRHMRSRLMLTREQEEKHQDFWNNDAWKDYL